MSKYVVLNENTLCYRIDGMDGHLGVLAESVIRGGHSGLNGPVQINARDMIRAATPADFDTYRVCSAGHL